MSFRELIFPLEGKFWKIFFFSQNVWFYVFNRTFVAEFEIFAQKIFEKW